MYLFLFYIFRLNFVLVLGYLKSSCRVGERVGEKSDSCAAISYGWCGAGA